MDWVVRVEADPWRFKAEGTSASSAMAGEFPKTAVRNSPQLASGLPARRVWVMLSCLRVNAIEIDLFVPYEVLRPRG